MTKLYFLSLMKRYRVFYILFAAGALTFLFQAFDNFGPKFDDDNPYIDQPTRESFSHFQPPNGNYAPDVLTDAQGFDNFDIGVNYAEQHISGNPNNPYQMFFGVNGSPVNQWYSLDGHSWTTIGVTLPSGTCCDPWTAYDAQNNLFYSVLTSSGNWVAKSTNYGASFGSFLLAVSCGDRSTLAADQTNGPYANYLYASGWSSCNFARSTNNGASWTTTASGLPNTTPGNMIAVGPYGTTNGGAVVLVTITGSNPVPSTFNFYLSTNGGASLTLVGSSVISPGYVGLLQGSRLTINNARTRPYPMIAFDNSNGTYRGRLYCVYASNVPAGNGNKPDIKLQYSTNYGASWSSEYIVNDNANPQLSDQWFPAIWCDKTNGKLYIKWYDTRNNPSTYGVDVYATYSTTGGTSFVTSQKLTTANWVYPYPACPPASNCYRGDYDAIWGEKFSSFAVWYDGRSSSYANIGSYFPDFAMKVIPGTFGTLNGLGDSVFSYVSVPAVKLYTDRIKYTATVTPTPGSGTLAVSFFNRTNGTLQDTLTTYPDSLKIRIRTTGGVTSQAYTVTITGQGRIGNANGTPVHKRTITFSVLTGISKTSNQVPEKFLLYQNFPNPFNPVTNIKFDIAKTGHVKLVVYNINGEAVGTLTDEELAAGQYNYDFNASQLASGVYFYKLITPGYTSVKKMILIK